MSITGPCKVAVYPRLEKIPDYSDLFTPLPGLLTKYKDLMEEKDYEQAIDVINEIFCAASGLVSITAKQLLRSHLGGNFEYESAKGKVQPTQKEIHQRLRERINNLGDKCES